jgi:hypothetical protein
MCVVQLACQKMGRGPRCGIGNGISTPKEGELIRHVRQRPRLLAHPHRATVRPTLIASGLAIPAIEYGRASLAIPRAHAITVKIRNTRPNALNKRSSSDYSSVTLNTLAQNDLDWRLNGSSFHRHT